VGEADAHRFGPKWNSVLSPSSAIRLPAAAKARSGSRRDRVERPPSRRLAASRLIEGKGRAADAEVVIFTERYAKR